MWNMKYMIIPIITGATGIVTRVLKKKFGGHTRKILNRFTIRQLYMERHTFLHLF